MNLQEREFSNGIHVLHLEIPHTKVVHCGMILNVGSRQENRQEMGMAHFIEHMVFKGTKRRKTFHIVNYLESVGGDLNAYTTKEKTCLYASINSDYVGRAIELLADITFNSTFPAREIEKEKQVISEEIDMYRDNPEEAIFEDYDVLVFPDHPLGRPILGTKNSISKFKQDALRNFTRKNYTSGRITFVSVGNVPFSKVIKHCEKWFGDVKLSGQRRAKNSKSKYKPAHQLVEYPGLQTHEVFGSRAIKVRGKGYVPFLVLNNHLGGTASNSRLNLNIREKFGLTYNILSFYQPYTDDGIWGIYFACEPKNRPRIENLVMKDLKTLRTKKMGSLRVSQIKKQLTGQLLLANENLLSKMLAIGKNQLDFQRQFEMADIVKEIEAVTASDLLDIANRAFDPEKFSSIIYNPQP